MSRLLDEREAQLGAKLFERRRGRVVPTATAQLLLDEVEQAYVSLDSLKTFASRIAEGESGRVSTAVLPVARPELHPGGRRGLRAGLAACMVPEGGGADRS